MRIAVLTCIAFCVFACKSKKQTIKPSHSFDQNFSLGVGDSAVFDDGLVFKLLRITSDSRCPKGTNCIWAGEVVAVFKANDTEELTLGSDPLKNPLKLGEYLISLNQILPEKTEAVIAQESYQLQFLIRKIEIEKSDR